MHRQVKFFLFLFVAISVLMIYLYKKPSGYIAEEKGRDFAVKSIDQLDSIHLTKGSQKLSLTKSGEQWKVNGGALVKNEKQKTWELVLQQLKVKFTAPSAKQDSLKKSILQEGIAVQFFEKGALEKSYWIADRPTDSTSIYGVENENTPVYALYVLGEKIVFDDFFSVNEGKWRTLNLWDFKREKWEEIEFASLLDSTLNYYLKIESTSIQLKTERSGQPIETVYSNVLEFLNDNSQKDAQAFLGYNFKFDKTAPLFKMTFSNAQENVSYIAYKKPAKKGTTDIIGLPLKYDNEQFYLQRGEEVFIVDYFSFEELLKGNKAFQ